jgi:hypothetical protein
MGYSEGVPVDVLAEKFRVDQSTVQVHVRRHVLPRRSPRLGPNQTEEAVRLHLTGQSLANSQSTSVSPPTPSPLPYGERVLLCGLGADGSPSTATAAAPLLIMPLSV